MAKFLWVISGVRKVTQRIGTPTHWAPEVLASKFGKEADLWSTVVMLYSLMSGRLPYCDKDVEESLRCERDLMMLVLKQSVRFDY